MIDKLLRFWRWLQSAWCRLHEILETIYGDMASYEDIDRIFRDDDDGEHLQ